MLDQSQLFAETGGLFFDASVIVFGGINEATTLKVLAIREAMALAEDLNLQSVHVASDCELVTEDIKQKSGAA